jgi:GTP pyrophosphokinase
VLGIIHSTWRPIIQEFDDYIAHPKPNGYQSIHTAVTEEKDVNIEIQIRTYDMDNASERGIAAHWKYKEGSGPSSAYEEKINWLRKVIDWQKEVNQNQENPEDLFRKMFEDRIYVFTPKGDIFDLENGATPIDFAYHLHSEVGHRCRGAKVNNALVPLTQALHTGDRVEILTAKEGKPSRDWLNPNLHYLKTKTARSKVRHWLNRIDRENAASWGITLPEKELHKTLPAKLKMGVAEKPLKEQPKTLPELDVLGKTKLLTKIAKCCEPKLSDEILGYITKSRGISIHLKSCANIQNSAKNHPERIIAINWKNNYSET